MFQAHVRHVDVIHESHSQLSSRPRRRTQTSPQPHTVRTHVTRRIPIHQMANSHQTVIAPEEHHLCQFRCSGANNTMYGMGTGHSSTASPSDKSFCTATCHIQYHIASASGVARRKLANCSVQSHLILESSHSRHHQLVVNCQ
jgi:hypothetical protein